ncbi:Pimeloyl-ACP methyl ester carboxylesterase [Polaromonas sp. YR568]|uniref:alpha/beta fold hydrolase n=1 Tax=Polaromonas sp. YR568 TaxID=1855301 RepID=UPI0008EA0A8C|nr:alpha/beta hydrolase [Polaromonas sp. YR568]SFU81383.1 Pimeloyl-ACP methyl ester carboxylesterase [Polaromonas sp. YR568]
MKHNFVLVHGAWHGGWCWRRVAQALQLDHHKVFTPTLTGLGERAHLLSPAINLDTHINDVINLIEAEELHEVTLAVHSYAGMIGTAVTDRMPERIKHLVYVDAVVPRPGESWSSTQASATQQQRMAAAQASPNFSFPAPDPEVFGLHDADREWVKRRQTPHPGNTYQAPLQFDMKRVASVPRTFVNCTEPALATIAPSRLRVQDPKFWDGAWLPNSRVVEIKTGHDPMISEPAALTKILLESAE